MINNTEYIKLFWEHEPNDDPVIILYEVDLENDRMVLRSIDIFVDRSCKNISDFYKDVIDVVTVPQVEEFNFQVWGEEFHTCLISKEEFGGNNDSGRRWTRANGIYFLYRKCCIKPSK